MVLAVAVEGRVRGEPPLWDFSQGSWVIGENSYSKFCINGNKVT